MKSRKTPVLRFLLWALLCVSLSAQNESVINWEGGFKLDVPDTWLRRNLRTKGLKLNSDDVQVSIETYTGITQSAQTERLRKEAESQGYAFKSERAFPINQVPTRELVLQKNGIFRIYYILMAGQRGFLWTVTSPSTDSEAFLEGKKMLSTFRVISN